jgi:hypothetical protein
MRNTGNAITIANKERPTRTIMANLPWLGRDIPALLSGSAFTFCVYRADVASHLIL